MAPYANFATDLLTGAIPVPAYLNPEKITQDAADEIDSKIGFRYITPVDVGVETPENRPTRLLLKRINAHLATGRLLMEAAAAGEDKALHAYAKRLVDESLAALDKIAAGVILLVDAPPIIATNLRPTGPLQYNKDSISQTDAFYDNILFAPPLVYDPRAWQ